jgi:general nucleoside transport system permease protein
VIELALISGFAAATVRVATPLALAAIGETITEKSGVLNLGIEGAMLAGALAAAVGAVSTGTAGGVLLAVLAGVVTSGIFAAVAVGAGADQIITGTAVTLGMTGLTGLGARLAFGNAGAGLTVPTLPVLPIPGLSAIPIIGPAFFTQSIMTYLAFLAIPGATWLLFRTRWGLEVRAAGESASAAAAMGVPVTRRRIVATLIGGAFAGLAGATLVLVQVGTFTEKMTAGRGFIAIAIVVLGRWHPLGAGLAALLFGAATALQFTFQASGSAVPYQLFLALPYLLALAVVAVAVGREKGPAGLAR